jgi:hypothetical protein
MRKVCLLGEWRLPLPPRIIIIIIIIMAVLPAFSDTTQAIDSLLDNSSTLRQFSSISFWDNFDNAAAVNGAQSSKVDQIPKTATVDLTKSSPKKSPKPIKKGLKRAHTPDHKRSKLSQDSSALDCCDYWLRFDSDDDSLERLGDFDTQATPAAHR